MTDWIIWTEREFRRIDKMTDKEIINKLHAMGLDIDKERFLDIAKSFISYEEMSEWLIKEHKLKLKKKDDDPFWYSIGALWKIWLPDKPTVEMIEESLMIIDDYLNEEKYYEAFDLWFLSWKNILRIIDDNNFKTVNEFNEIYVQVYDINAFVEDIEEKLYNYSLENKEYLNKRLEFCEDYLNRFPEEEKLIIENMKRSVAETYFMLGETEKTDELYKKWLDENPNWGWGWIGWSDCYGGIIDKNVFDEKKAKEILIKGLKVKDVEDEWDMIERLKGYKLNEDDEINYKYLNERLKQIEIEVKKRVKEVLATEEKKKKIENKTVKKDDETTSIENTKRKSTKIGRNDPCPCGSGKKYKNCCGKNY